MKNYTDESKSSEDNILRITDELVLQVLRTKRLILIMLLAIVVAVPVSWHIAPLLSGTPIRFVIFGYVAITIAVIFLVLGIRQWVILSKWTKRYKSYKELLKKVDQELDFEGREKETH